MMKLKNKKVLITGAAFIGVHLVERLIKEQVASITVINRTNNHKDHLKAFLPQITFKTCDLRDLSSAQKVIKGNEVIFHLAADHGGRGYVDLKQGNTSSNFLLDGSVLRACLKAEVEKVFFASSGCVYPNFAQRNTKKRLFLKESLVTPPYDADNIYGWAKLMGELTLAKYYQDFGLKSAVGRFFTVYGPYASESHAVMGTIAKAYVRQNPFEVWGDGTQVRNWTYVEDIVNGIVQSVKRIDNATPINLGTQERITVNSMVSQVNRHFNHTPRIKYVSMPTGPLNRVADVTRARELLNWTPQFPFKKGLALTIKWYMKNKDKSAIRDNLAALLIHD